MNADGSGQQMLARGGNSPAWSPDGRKIAFSGGAQGTFVMNPDGSGHRRLTRGPKGPGGRQASLSWSPDGRKLAFLSDAGRDHGDFQFDLYVMNADGSGLRRVTHVARGRVPGVVVSDPAWSPDGRKIAFVRGYRDVNADVYIMNADGSGLRRLTRNQAGASGPAWSPDGRKLAFVSDRDGTYEVYVMNADGSGQRRLTQRGA